MLIKVSRSLWVCALTLAWPAAATDGKTEIYVSVTGSDADVGTEEKPLRSLEGARDLLRKLRKSAQGKGGFTVWILGGIHSRSSTFELVEEDSGTEESPIVYRSRSGEEARLVGGKEIKRETFRPVTNTALLGRLPARARGKVLQAELGVVGITDYGGPGLEKREITLTEGLGDGPASGRRFYAFPLFEEIDVPGNGTWTVPKARSTCFHPTTSVPRSWHRF